MQRRVDTVSLNEKRRKEEREEVKRGWLPGRGERIKCCVNNTAISMGL